MADYPSNSFKSRAAKNEEIEEKKVEKVVTGVVKKKKKSEVSKFAGFFLSEDVSNVKSYVFSEVIIPLIKKGISDTVDMMLFGGSGKSRKREGSKISYGRYYDDDRKNTRTSNRTNSYNYDDVIIEDRREADDVLFQMDELMSKYQIVTVADFYDLVGVTGSYTDEKYGWTDIRSAKVVRYQDGWMIKMPRALPLD